MKIPKKTPFSRQGFARAASNCLLALAVPILALPGSLTAQTLLHRYSFATDASDSVGTANGTIVAPTTGNSASISGGLNLPGSGGGFGVSGYLSLPSGILTNTSSLTIECWFTQNTAQTWATPWDFGNNGNQNFALIPFPGNNGNHMEVAFTPHQNEVDLQSGLTFPSETEQDVAVTFNSATLTGNLYENGSQVATTVFPDATYTPGVIGGAGGTTENMLGNDVYGDAQFAGTIYELRIWNGAVSQRYLAASALVGPGTIVANLTPTSVSLTAGPGVVISGTEQATVTVQLAATAMTNLTCTGDATNWTSANTAVVTVNSHGLISGVGVGTTTVSATVAGVSATSGSITVTPQMLQHRYSFVSDATDSVGTANGTVVAPVAGNPATFSNGLNLPGTGTSGTPSGYVSLPNGILSGDTSITVETWVTQTTANTWAEIWSFGIPGGATNFALIPEPAQGVNNGDLLAAFEPNGGEVDIRTATAFPNGTPQYVVVTYNNSTLVGDLYLNGALNSTTTFPSTNYSPGSFTTIEDVLGSDPYGGDAQFAGTINEFRIWNGALSPLYVAVSAAAGPSVIVTNLTPTLVTVSVTNATLIGAQTEQATVSANFAAASGVTVTGAATNWISGNPSILTVSSSGLITALSGGSTTVSATVGGVTASSVSITVQSTAPSITQQPASQILVVGQTATFTVVALGGSLNYQWDFNTTPISGATNSTLTLTNLSLSEAGNYTVVVTNTLGSITSAAAKLTVDTAILEHRYSFVSDASDSVGGANGTLVAGNNPATINNGLMLPGTGTSGNPSGYVTLPNNIVSGDTSVTVETWVTQNSANEWAEIWSFGVNGGSVNFALIPSPAPGRNNGNMIVPFSPNNNEDDLNTPTTFPSGTQQYVAVTYNNSSLVGNLFLNGVLDGSVTLPNSTYSPGTYNTTEDVLGSDPFGGDAQFSGTISELRIWNGVVSPLYIAISSAAGPSVLVTNFTPTSVSVTETNASLISGQTEDAVATANFSGVSGVVVTTLVTNWISSNPSVLTVNSNGVITAVGSGSATISATLNGVTGTSSSVTVPNSAPIITVEPASSASLLVGGTLNASVQAIGNTPITYYWFVNGGTTPVQASTSPTLSIPNIKLSNAGTYTVLVSNQFGMVNSTALSVTVQAPTSYQQSLLDLNPLGYWPLNETSGTIAYDMAGSDNGTYIGGVSLGQPGPTNAAFGGTALSAFFDGSTGYVDIPEGPFNITNAITVVAWVDLLAVPTHFTDVFGHGDTSWRISLNQNSPSQPGAADGSAADITDVAGIDTGDWHMLVYTYKGGIGPALGTLYVDGAAKGTEDFTAAPTGNNLDVWIAGAPDYGTGSGGRLTPAEIADCAIFNYALSATEVQNLYSGIASVNLSIKTSGTNVTITWPTGVLLQATTLNGPWTTNSAAVSPYTIPATGKQQFFRVHVSP